jgi:hypothetical protein
VEAALAEPRCFPLKKKIAPPHPTQKPPYAQSFAQPLPLAQEVAEEGAQEAF